MNDHYSLLELLAPPSYQNDPSQSATALCAPFPLKENSCGNQLAWPDCMPEVVTSRIILLLLSGQPLGKER